MAADSHTRKWRPSRTSSGTNRDAPMAMILTTGCRLKGNWRQHSPNSLLKYHFAGHSERSAAAGEGGAARSRGTPWKVRSAREADKHRLLQPCRTRLTRGPSTSLRPLCRLRSARDDHAFEVFQRLL